MQAVENSGPAQWALLEEFLAAHAGSQFWKDHGLDRVRSWADYRLAVPVGGYERFAGYIEPMLEGQRSSLLGAGEKLVMFAKTSGTTGRAKYIPVTRRFVRGYRRGWNIFGLRVILEHPRSYMRHIVQLSSPEDEEITPSGVPAGAISGLLATTQKWIIRKHYPAPLQTRWVKDATSKYYVTMRMAMGKDPAFITTANPSTILALARTVRDHAETLIRDVADGGLSKQFDIPGEVRRACRWRLSAQPALARRLEGLLSERGELLPKDYWRLDFLCCWTGGTLGLYLREFPHFFGDLPIRDIGLLASEARMSLPLQDGTASGLLDVQHNVFEFIPEAEYGSATAGCLLPHELEVGGRYFVVLTNPAGLFRYDMGDLVEVTGMQGPTPLIRFLSRGKHTSSLTGEKLTEHQAVTAFGEVSSALARGHTSFVMGPVWGDPPGYRLSVDGPLPAGCGEGQFAEAMDAALQRLNVEYAEKRASGRLGRLTVRCLAAGTIERLDRALLVSRSGRGEQFKHQYLYTQPGDDDAALARAEAG